LHLSKQFSRREALKIAAVGSAAMVLPFERVARTSGGKASGRAPSSALPVPFTNEFKIPPVAVPVFKGPDPVTGKFTEYYQLNQQVGYVNVLTDKSKPTLIYGYNGGTPGPTIHCQRGTPIVVQHINNLPGSHPWGYTPWTSTHLHGSCSLPEYDGYASDITQPGEYKNYHYPNVQDARTLWYHDHGVHHTAENAYMGLAAQYHLHDDVEAGLPIPKWDRNGPQYFDPYNPQYDVPLILKDLTVAADGSMIFDNSSFAGLYGEVICVNGVPWPNMKVYPRKYRFRVLDASISRSYKLALSTGDPITVIGTDGGIMPAPQQVANFRIGMAERYEIVIDFSKYKVGQKIVLKNLLPPNNINFANSDKVMQFEVIAGGFSTANNDVPSQLNPNMETMGLKRADAKRTHELVFERKGAISGGDAQWTINGTTWKDVIDSNYTKVLANPEYNDVEIWRLTNKSGGWFHPVHIHLVDFQVLSRNGNPPFAWEKGPKDVVYCGENESVEVIMRFTNQRGRYMVHCHNLVHEDHDMMGQFQVGITGKAAAAPAPHAPILAAAARKGAPTPAWL